VGTGCGYESRLWTDVLSIDEWDMEVSWLIDARSARWLGPAQRASFASDTPEGLATSLEPAVLAR
jgi:hypothetical protein